jgi:hypothetical protein
VKPIRRNHSRPPVVGAIPDELQNVVDLILRVFPNSRATTLDTTLPTLGENEPCAIFLEFADGSLEKHEPDNGSHAGRPVLSKRVGQRLSKGVAPPGSLCLPFSQRGR